MSGSVEIARGAAAENDNGQIGFDADERTLPQGYYRSRFFIGSYLAICFGLWSCTAVFGYASPILSVINEDLGPDARYIWISLIYTVVLAVSMLLVGTLSDIFGRRYFMIGGAVLGVVGSIVCATAKNIPTLIGGNVLLALASATQLSFAYVQAELVPMKHRYLSSAGIYCFSLPGSGFGAVIAYSFVTKYSVGWRGIYWLLLAVNGISFFLWALFYFPPNFHEKHKRDIDSKMYWVKNLDYVGLFLFTAGFVVFLLGLSWGGSVYPWKSAAVICSIVLGGVVLIAFIIWELHAPIKQPILPMHIFRNGKWTAAIVLLGLGAGVYYAFAIVWPTQIAVLYAEPENPLYTGWLANLIGLGFITGQISAGLFARAIGKTRIQCMVVFTVGAIFFACCATVNADNKKTMIALVYIGCVFIGWNESICLTNATILVDNQQEIGIAGGAAGSTRSAISAVLVAIYTTVLTNRLGSTIPAIVPPALVNAGLPESSVPAFLQALQVGTADAFSSVPGISASIIAVGTRAYKVASADAYRTVYLVTIAFSGLGVILTWFAPNTEEYMTDKVAATLHHSGHQDEKTEVIKNETV